MKSLPELKLLIEKELEKIQYPTNPSQLYQPIDYVLGIGGKRIRPVLLLMAHQLFDNNIENAIPPALGIEVFHNFTLLHDDIMDNAPLRRGKPTVHKKWNPNVAILSGDIMLVQAYQLIGNVDKSIVKQVLEVFCKAAIQVCEGQQWDMDFDIKEDVSITDYLKMVEYKTSILLAAALKIGAITGGATDEDTHHLYEFGRNIGIAFQLQDDLLDAYGNPDLFGKQVGGDILANKKTYLYLKALELANENQKDKLRHYFSDNNFEATEKIDGVKAIFDKLSIYNHTKELMMQYHKQAMDHLNQVQSDKKRLLINFAKILFDREI